MTLLREVLRETSAEFAKGARRGYREALVGFWTPLRPSYWRYVSRAFRLGGGRAGLVALVHRGYERALTQALGPGAR